MQPVSAEDRFWRWSVALYGAPGVESACLELQESCGANVNILLFCCWLGATGGGRLTGTDLHRLDAATAAWNRDAVAPLRAVRRALKSAPPAAAAEAASALRQQVKAAELAAERITQTLLVHHHRESPAAARAPAQRAADIRHNLRAYLRFLDTPPALSRAGDVLAARAAACPEV